MPRILREKIVPWAGASVAVASLAALLQGGTMTLPNLDTQLMAMTLAWYGLHLLRHILGPMRRYSGHWLVQYGAMAADYLHLPLAVYAVNSVRYSSDSRPYHVLWCSMLPVFSFIFFMNGPMRCAYTLGDSPLRGWHFLNALYSWFSVWSLFGTKLDQGNSLAIIANIAFYCMGAFPVLLPYMWSGVTSALAHYTEVYADWMKKETTSMLSPFFDGDANNRRLNGCEYPIFVERGGQLMITRLNVLSSDITVDGTVPDILLSYSFSRMLARRYFGYDCAEEGNTKVRDFALRELMQPPHYKRVFTITEVQLAFLHDEYFMATTSLTTKHKLQKSWLSAAMILFSSLGLLLLGAAQTESHAFPLWFDIIRSFFCMVTVAIFLCETALGTREPTDSDIIFKDAATGTFPPRRPYWKNEIGQYSLIQDYDSCSAKKISLFLLKGIILSDWPPTFIKHHPVEEDAVQLPDSVRKLVARTLRAINGPPTNGIKALQRNRDRILQKTMDDDLSWTCKSKVNSNGDYRLQAGCMRDSKAITYSKAGEEETHTHTILIWHIATCYMLPPDSYLPRNLHLVEISTCYRVATELSRYCAYLVAFLPGFLPVNKITTQMVFQDVLQEAKCLLGSTGLSLEDKRTKMRGLGLPDGGLALLTTFEKGVKLGRQLERLDTLLRCKVMAEFWAETILYIAPSDNAALHFEHLAQGGELVTHLWAMLSNAGILKRASEETNTPSVLK